MEHLRFIGKITCKHDYANNSNGLEIIPTTETQLICQKEGLWLYQKKGTIEVYTDKITSSILDIETLLFWVKVTDDQFYNYTQLDYKLQGQEYLLYFTNPEEKETLTPENAVLKNVQRKTQIVVIDEVVTEEEQIKVYDNKGTMVLETSVPIGSRSILLDLTYENDGMYTWTFNGYSGSFFLTDENLKHIIGVYQFQINSESKHQTQLQFQVKKTYWEYLIISKEDIEGNAYTIIDTHGNFTFTCQGKKSIVDIEAISYISDQEISYKKYPETLFKLVPNSENISPYLTIEDRILPNASPENIRIHHTAEATAFKTQTILYI